MCPRKGSYFEHKFGEKKPVFGFSKAKAIPEEYVVRNNAGKIIDEKWLHNGTKNNSINFSDPGNKTANLFLDKFISGKPMKIPGSKAVNLFLNKFISGKPMKIMVMGSGKGENLYHFKSKFIYNSLYEICNEHNFSYKWKNMGFTIKDNPLLLKLMKQMGKEKSDPISADEVMAFIKKNNLAKEFNPSIDVLNLTKSNLSNDGKKYVNKDYSGKLGKETYFEDYNNPKLMGKYDYVNALESVGKHTWFAELALFKSALLLKKGGIANIGVTVPISWAVGLNYNIAKVLQEKNLNSYIKYKKYSTILDNYFKLAERKYKMKFKVELVGQEKFVMNGFANFDYRITRLK